MPVWRATLVGKPQRAGFQVEFLKAGRPIFSGNRGQKGGSFDAHPAQSSVLHAVVAIPMAAKDGQREAPREGATRAVASSSGASESRRGQGARDDLTTVI
jgi:hypothetical protein